MRVKYMNDEKMPLQQQISTKEDILIGDIHSTKSLDVYKKRQDKIGRKKQEIKDLWLPVSKMKFV